MFGFGKKKCEYCRNEIENGKETKKDVKVPGYVGTHPKAFCCEEHASKYEDEVDSNNSKGGGGCCG